MEPHEMAEKLVEKCGISYEEAGKVLKEANYDLLEAMIILERQGRLGGPSHSRYTTGIMNNYVSASGGKTAADAESMEEFLRITWDKLCGILKSMLRYHLIISLEERKILSFPAVIAVILLLCTAGLAIAALIISLVMGCSYEIKKI